MSGITDVTCASAAAIPILRRATGSSARCACLAELRAVCAILFGVSALCLSFLTFPWLMSLFVVFLLADGALVIFFAFLAAWQHERGAAPVLAGVVSMLVAAALLLVPTMTVPAVVTLLCVWSAAAGALGIGTVRKDDVPQGRCIVRTVGSMSIGWACLLWLAHGPQPMALAWWLGPYTLCLGFMLLLLEPRLRADLR